MSASQMINVNSQNKNVSRMAKAMNGWNDKFYVNEPKGVFGSTAIIRCNGAVIKSSDLDLEFTVPFDDDMEEDEVEIIIYNLSNTTVNQLTKNASITIEAGYKGDTGVIFKGYISKRKTVYEGVDRKTTLKCLDRVNSKTLKEKTYKAGTKASAILKSLVQMTGTPIAVFKMRRDYTYKDEQKVDGDLMENIKKYAEVCGVSVYVNKGQIYAEYLKSGGNNNEFNVQESTGMINTPSEYEEEVTAEDYKETIKGYEIEMLLQHRMTTGSIINLKSVNANGTYRVRSGEHIFNESEATTKIKVF